MQWLDIFSLRTILFSAETLWCEDEIHYLSFVTSSKRRDKQREKEGNSLTPREQKGGATTQNFVVPTASSSLSQRSIWRGRQRTCPTKDASGSTCPDVYWASTSLWKKIRTEALPRESLQTEWKGYWGSRSHAPLLFQFVKHNEHFWLLPNGRILPLWTETEIM